LRRPDGDLEVLLEPLADLGALLARDCQQLGLVVAGQWAHEAAVAVRADRPIAGRITAAQLDRGAREAKGVFLGRTTQQYRRACSRRQHPAFDGEAARS